MRSFLHDLKRPALEERGRGSARASSTSPSLASSSSTTWVRDFDDNGAREQRWESLASSSSANASRANAANAFGAHPLKRQWVARLASAKARDAFERESLDAYTKAHEREVFCGTWNTNGKAPRAGVDVRRWLTRDGGRRLADVVVVGFQEIIPLTAGNVLTAHDSAMTEMWENVIDNALNGNAANQESTRRRGAFAESGYERAAFAASERNAAQLLGKKASDWVSFDDNDEDGLFGAEEDVASPVSSSKDVAMYRPVAQKQLVGVYVTVWVKATLLPQIKEVRVSTVSTGINIGLGVLGNKGAAAVWMKLHDTPLVFVCSHLSSGSKPGDELKRNEDYHAIVDQLEFASREGIDLNQEAYRIDDAASAIWIGDLNYRLNLPDGVVRSSIEARNTSSLLAADQLNIERAAGRAFAGWYEGEVTFAPTYKYRPGTNIYSGAGDGDDDDFDGTQKKEEEKKRTPAWCDRILWKGDFDISLIDYGRAELTHSDHKPVYAVFSIVIRELLPQKLQDLLSSLRRQLDMDEMKTQPTCTILNPIIDLGPLKYAEEASGTFTISNTGKVLANFRLVSPIAGGPAHPGWLDVKPADGTLRPGEKCQVRVKAHIEGGRWSGPKALRISRSTSSVSLDALADLESQPSPVDAILVLRLEGGRDFFVSVQGMYMPCAFGQSIENLPTAMFPPNVPQIVGVLVDYLFESASAAPGLFRVPFEKMTTRGGVAAVSRALENTASGSAMNLNVPGINAYDVGQTLISFFSALPERLLSQETIVAAADAVAPNAPPSKEFVDRLLVAHLSIKARSALRHATSLVHCLTEECAQTGSNTDIVSIVSTFAKCWFPESHDPPSRARIAFVGALAGCRPAFIRAYDAPSPSGPPSASISNPTLARQGSERNLIDF